MPSVIDPEVKEDPNTSNTPSYKEPELFAAEVEMEKKSSNLGVYIMVAALIAVSIAPKNGSTNARTPAAA